MSRGEELLQIPLTPVNPPPSLGLDILEDVAGIRVGETRGVLAVASVRGGSRAAEMGIERGDLLVGANGVELRTEAELNEAIVRGADRSSIILNVARGRFVYTLTFPMGSGIDL